MGAFHGEDGEKTNGRVSYVRAISMLGNLGSGETEKLATELKEPPLQVRKKFQSVETERGPILSEMGDVEPRTCVKFPEGGELPYLILGRVRTIISCLAELVSK